MVLTAEGLWDIHRFQGRRHLGHWTLQSEIYLILAHLLDSWTSNLDEHFEVMPDALITLLGVPHPIALEADTGKETQSQWRDKLAGYTDTPPDWHILVIAQGKALRQKRLRSWLRDLSPRPWLIIPVETLMLEQNWSWTSPLPVAPTPVIPPVHQTLYLYQGQPIEQAIAQQGLKNGDWHIAARERRRATTILFLEGKRFPM